MPKYVSTKDGSIGGKLLDNGKVLVATKVNGTKVVEIVELVDDIIDQTLPIARNILKALQDFFNDVLHRFPPVIKVAGIEYVFTVQPAPWKAIDRMFYQSTLDANDQMFKHEGETKGECRKKLRKELKEYGYM